MQGKADGGEVFPQSRARQGAQGEKKGVSERELQGCEGCGVQSRAVSFLEGWTGALFPGDSQHSVLNADTAPGSKQSPAGHRRGLVLMKLQSK